MDKIRLDDIEIDLDLQPRVDGLDADHVRSLQDAPDGWPPIAVVAREGRYLLVDGFHRYAAAQNLGRADIAADVLPSPGDGDLHALAFALNAVHGRPLSLTDRRAFAARLLGRRPEVSNMEIARHAGLSPTTVATIRDRLESDNEIASAPERIGADGARYPASSPASARPVGELPVIDLESSVGQAIGRLISPVERIQQRRLVQYLERLAVALEDHADLDGWTTAEAVADACRLALGDADAASLGGRLGTASEAVLDVAYALGSDENGDAA